MQGLQRPRAGEVLTRKAACRASRAGYTPAGYLRVTCKQRMCNSRVKRLFAFPRLPLPRGTSWRPAAAWRCLAACSQVELKRRVAHDVWARRAEGRGAHRAVRCTSSAQRPGEMKERRCVFAPAHERRVFGAGEVQCHQRLGRECLAPRSGLGHLLPSPCQAVTYLTCSRRLCGHAAPSHFRLIATAAEAAVTCFHQSHNQCKHEMCVATLHRLES